MITTRLTTRADRFEVALGHDKHVQLEDASGWRITAVGGTLWVTQDGDPRDVVLAPGEHFAFDRPQALVSSFDGGSAGMQRDADGPHHACMAHACAELALAA